MSDNEKPGYGNPPKGSQFAKGKSGNPKGRPKGSKNFATTLNKELNVRVPITENGTRKTVSKQEAIAKQLVNKSAGGDARSMSMVLGEIRQLDEKAENTATENVFTGEAAEWVFQSLVRRIRSADPTPKEPNKATDSDSNANDGEPS